jgi:YidC/Oxa1 family membrane protein insertase
MKPPSQSLDWIKSAIAGNPDLGWDSTIAYCTIPVILFISQTISMKVLQPPKDPNRVYTEQEQVTQGILNQLPFILAFFSLNVPAGLGVYWIISNVLTTVVTVAIKSTFKDDGAIILYFCRMMCSHVTDVINSYAR